MHVATSNPVDSQAQRAPPKAQTGGRGRVRTVVETENGGEARRDDRWGCGEYRRSRLGPCTARVSAGTGGGATPRRVREPLRISHKTGAPGAAAGAGAPTAPHSLRISQSLRKRQPDANWFGALSASGCRRVDHDNLERTFGWATAGHRAIGQGGSPCAGRQAMPPLAQIAVMCYRSRSQAVRLARRRTHPHPPRRPLASLDRRWPHAVAGAGLPVGARGRARGHHPARERAGCRGRRAPPAARALCPASA